MSVAEITADGVHVSSRKEEARRLIALAWTLAITDWKLKFYGSALGALWTLVRPFAFFGVILFVFTQIAHLDKNVDHYNVYILLALVFWNFFAEITVNSVQSLVQRENLLRKMRFNPIVVPMAITMTALLNLGLTFTAVLIFVFAAGVVPDFGWLELPLIVLSLTLFASGIGMLLGALYVRYRDMQPIWEVVSQMMFYGSAILYTATKVTDPTLRKLVLCNPLAATFTQMRRALIDDKAPSLSLLMGKATFAPVLVTIGIFALGLFVFLRESPRVAENL